MDIILIVLLVLLVASQLALFFALRDENRALRAALIWSEPGNHVTRKLRNDLLAKKHWWQ